MDKEKFDYVNRIVINGKTYPRPPEGYEWYEAFITDVDLEAMKEVDKSMFKIGDKVLKMRKICPDLKVKLSE